jgi:hypothetical protein
MNRREAETARQDKEQIPPRVSKLAIIRHMAELIGRE